MFRNIWRSEQTVRPSVKRNVLIFRESDHAVARMCVPDDGRVITKVTQEFHDSATSAHPGIKRTQLRIAQWYYWPKLEADFQAYVNNCETCAQWKSSCLEKAGKMIPIPTPTECWEVVSMDFVTGLPVSNGSDAILTVVDKFPKRPRYAAIHTTSDALEVASVFFDSIVRHHVLPKAIISDRDPKFTSTFWKSLMSILGIKTAMITAYRAQADGQAERQNLVLQDALWCMVSYHGSDWAGHLGTIEFAHATSVNASTGFTPFELDTGRKVNSFVSQEFASSFGSPDMPMGEYAENFAANRQKLLEMAQKNLREAQEREKRYYDRRRRDVESKAGDMVMLDTRNLPFQHVTGNTDLRKAKLAAKKIGPFEIEKMVNPNVARLILPKRMSKLHPSFNIEFLNPYMSNPAKFPSRPISKASPIVVEPETGEVLHIVEALLKKRQFNCQTEWLVKWHGLPAHESTWEKEKQIKRVSHWHDILHNFRNRQREVNSGGCDAQRVIGQDCCARAQQIKAVLLLP